MLVVLISATSAERIKRYLASKKIASEIVQTPKSISNGGCGYSLRIKEIYKNDVLEASKTLHLTVKGFYEETGDGRNRIYRKKGWDDLS